jgi:hypothetical protein
MRPIKITLQLMMIILLLAAYPSFGQWTNSGDNIYYNDGKVGIGTAAPAHTLDVNGTLQTKYLHLKNILGGWQFTTNNGGKDLLFRTDPNTGLPETRMYLKQNGNVGIGTSDPATRLHIKGADNNGTTSALKITSGAQNMLIDGNEIDGDNGIYLNHNVNENVILATGGGNVGIGTNSPSSKLHIVAPNYARLIMTATSPADNVRMFIDARGSAGNIRGQLGTLSDHDIRIYTNSQPRMIIKNNGNIGIGTVSPHNDYKLSVNGKIRAKEIVVETGWADFVFEEDYQLMPLREVEAYIHTHKHLPDVPSAKVIEEKGVSVGEMEAKLLQKIEELTLHLIALSKENDALKNRVSRLEVHEEN